MSKNSRDNPKKYYPADYFGWKYYFGGHYLKQWDKRQTIKKFRRVSKKRIRKEVSENCEQDD